eukprot:PhF_6_TR9079/c0_g1_i1/m.14152
MITIDDLPGLARQALIDDESSSSSSSESSETNQSSLSDSDSEEVMVPQTLEPQSFGFVDLSCIDESNLQEHIDIHPIENFPTQYVVDTHPSDFVREDQHGNPELMRILRAKLHAYEQQHLSQDREEDITFPTSEDDKRSMEKDLLDIAVEDLAKAADRKITSELTEGTPSRPKQQPSPVVMRSGHEKIPEENPWKGTVSEDTYQSMMSALTSVLSKYQT